MSDYTNPSLITTGDASVQISNAECFSRLLALLKTYEGDPLEGLAGYLVTEDPTYLPEHTEIKMLIHSLGRDELLRYILLRALNRDPASEEV